VNERPPDPASRGALDGCEPFQGLRPRVLDQIFGRMRERGYAAGETLLRQGDNGDALLVVFEGAASVILRGHDGATHTLAEVSRGAVVGEMSILTDGPATADVVAKTPVRALALLAGDFRDLAGRNPEITIVLTNVVADRLGGALQDGLGGKVLNGHRILRCVGRGAMAVVYEAENLESGDRVALKMMSHRLVYNPGAVSRFEREARIVQSLRHENIARLMGTFPAFGTEFIVMEFCRGEALNQLLTRHGPFPPAQAKPLLGQIASALTFVHERGIVHRDLKPGNVILTPQGRAKLTDFGLAKQGRQLDDDTATLQGTAVGTPLYMAPEQMMGEDSGPRMDVYAFGCLALELVTGDVPFRVSSFRQIYRDKMSHKVPAAEQLGPGIDRPFRDFIARAMNPEPEARLDTLREAAEWRGELDPAFLASLLSKSS
jgi:eukaryotic-like serine/threonine-protein kinase